MHPGHRKPANLKSPPPSSSSRSRAPAPASSAAEPVRSAAAHLIRRLGASPRPGRNVRWRLLAAPGTPRVPPCCPRALPRFLVGRSLAAPATCPHCPHIGCFALLLSTSAPPPGCLIPLPSSACNQPVRPPWVHRPPHRRRRSGRAAPCLSPPSLPVPTMAAAPAVPAVEPGSWRARDGRVRRRRGAGAGRSATEQVPTGSGAGVNRPARPDDHRARRVLARRPGPRRKPPRRWAARSSGLYAGPAPP